MEEALQGYPHLIVERLGNAVIARTDLGRSERVILAGHLDTVPPAGNAEARIEHDTLHGLGSVDMKGGVAVILNLAATVTTPSRDVTYVLYDGEEVEAHFNGLARIARERPELLAADLAILMEPTDAGIEAGCQGTLRAEVTVRGIRAHTARAWKGDNAIHAAAPVLATLGAYEARRPIVDGLEYREALVAVAVRGGIAGNVVPDQCVITVNHRFAPDRSIEEAKAHVASVFAGLDVEFIDEAPAARPGLDRPAAGAFVAAVGEEPRPKYGWTDVARFSELGVPALNFGPGDPALAHAADERVPVSQIRSCQARLRAWLTGR